MRKHIALILTLLVPWSSIAALSLKLSSDGASGPPPGLLLQWTLSGLTGTYYSCEVSTNNGVTWGVSNVTAQAYWNIIVPYNQTWKFRLETIIGGVGQGDFSNTNTVYGDLKPQYVTISAASTSQINLAFKNISFLETGFLVEEATNSVFTNSVFYSLPPTPQIAYYTNWIHNFSFLPNVTYWYRIYCTNSANGTTNAGTSLPSLAVSIAPNKSPNPTPFFVARTTDVANQTALSWTSGGGSIQNWILQVTTGSTPGTWATVYAPADSNGGSFTTNSLTSGTLYWWRVAATNGAGFSDWVTNRVSMPIPGSSTTGDWYVDLNARTNGSNWSGTNRANAFADMSSVMWSKFSAGQRLWVAPGAYWEWFEALTPGSGTTFTIHFDTNYTGMAYFLGCLYRAHTDINGALSDSFTVTNGSYPTLWQITNNIGFKFASTNTGIARGIYNGGAGTANGVHFCEIGPLGVWQTGLGESDQAAIGYIDNPLTGTDIAYNWIHDIIGSGISVQGNNDSYGDFAIHNNIVERISCNYLISGFGMDLYGNYFLSWHYPQVGHPDGWQGVWGHDRIYNNYFRDSKGGRLIYPEGAITNHANMLIYGNTFDFRIVPTAEAICFTTEPTAYNPGEGPFPWPLMTMSNVLVANNTFIGLDLSANARKTDVTSLQLYNWTIVNNAFYGFSPTTPVALLGVPLDQANYNTISFPTANVVFDWNAAPNNTIRYSSNITTVAGLPYINNTLTNFGFVNNSDWHLTNSLAGTNLTSAFGAIAPSIGTDMAGVTRTTWQMGAYETVVPSQQTNDVSLVSWLRFDNLANNDNIIDWSFNHAGVFQEDLFHWPTNGPGHAGGNLAAYFNSYNSLDPSFFGEGQYGGISYTNNIDSMTNATFAFWGKNFASPDGTLGSVHNSVWFSSGAENDNEVVGSIYMGRHGTANTVLIIQTNNSALHNALIGWPDNTTNGATAWHHYAWTYDGANLVGYFDGVAFTTNNIGALVPKLRVGGNYMSISGWPHNGTIDWNINNTPQTQPSDHSQLDDGYPNAGFLNGAIEDFRVYNRTLTSAQVAVLASGAGTNDPVIDSQPQSQTVVVGQTATFTVSASGASTIHYQWTFNGVNVGTDSASYSRSNCQFSDNFGQVQVTVTDLAGSVQSTIAVLNVATDPYITSQPQNTTVNLGQLATFSVTATGTTPLYYQWYGNGVPLAGVTQSSYTTAAVTCGYNNKQVSVLVSNSVSTVMSTTATLTVNGCSGSNAVYSSQIGGGSQIGTSTW